ncbi:hypothetical protein NPIL_348461 [Nephila pilipes]|uniref:Uncharacterized protein n=1 Tax=Nephila pilipes TaxID=299642 RepID=A0A8X6TUK1_NEPPI|nr:hypothetical protein NPIL_348461 [Nephila pilipes]
MYLSITTYWLALLQLAVKRNDEGSELPESGSAKMPKATTDASVVDRRAAERVRTTRVLIRYLLIMQNRQALRMIEIFKA